MNLAETTHDFWRISLAYHKRKEGSAISTGTAISVLNVHLRQSDMTHKLWLRIHDLSSDIIQGNIQRHG